MSSSENQKQISLTLVVDMKKQLVLYAEAGKNFVDVWLSFLTLPLGTVARLVNEKSTVQPCRLYSISSLRESVHKLDSTYFSASWNKEMLLNPRSPMDNYYINIGYSSNNYDNTPFSKGFKGYLRVTTCYIVSDDLKVMPSEVNTTFWMLRNFGLDSVTKRLIVSVTQKEVLDLLKFSLWSKTPLTDLFLRKKLQIQDSGTQVLSKVMISEGQGKWRTTMKLKVVISKSERKVLFAQAEEDFTDQIVSFLTISLAAVKRLEPGNAGLGCIDNLYKSLTNLDAAKDFEPNMRDLKDKLFNPLIVTGCSKNQLLPIYVLANSASGKTSDFIRWQTKYMVKDDLSVEPFSSPAALSFLVESKEGERDLEEMDLGIGVNEVFGILKAAITSTSALTIGLRPLLTVVKGDK